MIEWFRPTSEAHRLECGHLAHALDYGIAVGVTSAFPGSDSEVYRMTGASTSIVLWSGSCSVTSNCTGGPPGARVLYFPGGRSIVNSPPSLACRSRLPSMA